MQLPGAPNVDIVSVYAQLAEDGATFLLVAAVVYLLGRLLVVPARSLGRRSSPPGSPSPSAWPPRTCSGTSFRARSSSPTPT